MMVDGHTLKHLIARSSRLTPRPEDPRPDDAAETAEPAEAPDADTPDER